MARPERDVAARLQMLVATGFGSGYAPVAPGTFGSLVGVALAWVLGAPGWPLLLAGCLVVIVMGLWASEGAARRFGRSDPGPVVIDEIAGQMVSLLFVPLSPATALAGFLLFRLFDIVKPYPAGRLEALPGGSGIMADDLMAGVYANLCLQLGLYVLSS